MLKPVTPRSVENYPDAEVAALFVLLRAGLWETDPDDLTLFPLPEEGWRRVYGLARQHTVTGMVYRGLCHLPDALLPSEALLVRWVAEVDAIEQQNRRMNRALTELCSLFGGQGLTPIVKKGQGIARLYVHPLLRECGDIDFYFTNKREREEAVQLIRQTGKNGETEADGSVHYRWRGIEVEHHPHVLDVCNPFLQKYLAMVEQALGYSEVTLSVEGEDKITIPSPTLNVLLLNTHIMKHVLGRGIGLRQLCDLARACSQWQGQLYPEVIKSVYRKVGIVGWSRLLDSFLVTYLGLPEAALPYPDKQIPSVLLLDKVLAGGNFGHYRNKHSRETDNRWKCKLYTAHSFLRNVRFAADYAPKEAFWTVTNLLIGQTK